MKLYTEEEVKKAIKMARSSTNIFTTPFLYDKEEVLNKLTPIALPTNEEIDKIAMAMYGFKALSVRNVLEYKAFKRGAKLVINKIQEGNHETN